ncbi:MAG TPA: hypothetical protein VLB29_03510 [Nocardioidaceae bacterium]|nr:hypothetical protein [Nocardioidaceae bacterium]
MTSAPENIGQYVDALCHHLADLQDRYEKARDLFEATADAPLQAQLVAIGEICGMRRALAIALGLDPQAESDKEGGADTYHAEWRERHGR